MEALAAVGPTRAKACHGESRPDRTGCLVSLLGQESSNRIRIHAEAQFFLKQADRIVPRPKDRGFSLALGDLRRRCGHNWPHDAAVQGRPRGVDKIMESRWDALFPGQGAQFVGMGKWLYEGWSVCRECFAEADDALDYRLSSLIFDGPADRLEATEWQQPAILTVSVASWRAVKHERPDFRPLAGLGLSLGEYSAYVASGALQFADAVRLTRVRGQAMQQAVPPGLGGMMAIVGLGREEVEALCQQAGGPGAVEPANYNAPGQIVASGLRTGLDRLAPLVQAAGGKAVQLAVSAPFHCSLLAPASHRLSEALAAIRLDAGAFPVIANVDAEPCSQPEDIIPRLIAQVSHPVHFEQGIRAALAAGGEGFIEFAPGHGLAGLVKKVDRRVPVMSVENPAGLAKALELLVGAKL